MAVLRETDLWQECGRIFHLPGQIKPQGADGAKWKFTVKVGIEWVEKDPLLLQMMHDVCKPYEYKAIVQIGEDLSDAFAALMEQYHDISSRNFHLNMMSVIAKEIISGYAEEAHRSCARLVQEQQATSRSYTWYKVKEGAGFTTKAVTTGTSTVMSGVSLGGGVPGIIGGVLGFTGVLKNVIQLATQMYDWTRQAEQLQGEINRIIRRLQKEQAKSGYFGSTAWVTGKEFVKGVIGEIDPLQLERLIMPRISDLDDLVGKYKSKLDGVDIRAHSIASQIYVVMDWLTEFKKHHDVNKIQIRYSKSPSMNLVGLLGKGLESILYSRNKRALDNWKFLRNHVLTIEQRKYGNMEKKLDKLINQTESFYQRVEAGRRTHRKYAFQLEQFKAKEWGSKWGGPELAAKVTGLLAWDVPQIVTFNTIGIVETATTAAKDASQWIQASLGITYDILSTAAEPAIETEILIAEEVLKKEKAIS